VITQRVPPHAYFAVSAVFHYLGPAFAVLLFDHVDPLGVAWLRIASAGAIFALWRRPWRAWPHLRRETRRLLLAWGAVPGAMNSCFYLAIEVLPLGTVAAIEFLPVIALAALSARTPRNLAALVLAVTGVYLLTDIEIGGEPVGLLFAGANALLLGHRVSRDEALTSIDGLALSMLIAVAGALPVGAWDAAPAFTDPLLLAAAVGVGVCSSVIPYVCDQLVMRRLARGTYSLMIALLPATATVIGVIVLTQIPSPLEVTGVMLVIVGVAVHREHERQNQDTAS
jgi:inner membrane transporter RhtA